MNIRGQTRLSGAKTKSQAGGARLEDKRKSTEEAHRCSGGRLAERWYVRGRCHHNQHDYFFMFFSVFKMISAE